MNGKIIAQKVHKIQNSLSGVKNSPAILGMLSKYGYTEEKIADGQAKLDLVKELIEKHIALYGDQCGATDFASKIREKAYDNYMIILKVIRIAFKDDINAMKSYLATGRRSQSLSGWLREAQVMYGNLLKNTQHLDVLKQYGIDEDRVREGAQQVRETSKQYSLQLEKKGEAQQSTLERNKAFAELTKWHSNFRAIARIAWSEKPQLLEAMGIITR
jgi:hypothetical protein